MPINFNLEEVREQFNCSVYLETGLYYATRKQASIHSALSANFDKVYSVELRKDLVNIGKRVLNTHIKTNRLKIINDDSNNLGLILNNDREIFKNRTMFFLDAHVDNQNIKKYINKCPLFNEIEAISKLNRNDNIILIDDLRILREDYPWGETAYGKINFLEKIKEKILEINSNYKFKTLNGHVPDDVLLCYLETPGLITP